MTPLCGSMYRFIKHRLVVIIRRLLSGTRFFRKRRRVLFLCHNALMADYLSDIYELLEGDSRLELYLRFCPSIQDDRPEVSDAVRNRLPLRRVSRWASSLLPWDLAITADHIEKGFCVGRRVRLLRIPHGALGGINKKGYDYYFGGHALARNGRPLYTRMFVASHSDRAFAVRKSPAFAEVVAVVGNLHDDALLEAAEEREKQRRRLGINSGDIVVYVAGSWGRWNLYETLGDDLLERASGLDGKYRFILDIHPNEFRPRKDGDRVWGDYLRQQRSRRFIVRDPGESWVPYIAASDVFICDYTSLVSRAVLLRLPLIFSPFPDSLSAEGSPGRKLREVSPQLSADASNLEDCLRRALKEYPLEVLRGMLGIINSYPGKSALMISEELRALLFPGEERGREE